MKQHRSTIILAVVFLVGVSLLLYPAVSDYWNQYHQSRAISDYISLAASLDNSEYPAMRMQAEQYNKQMQTRTDRWFLSEQEWRNYESLLNLGGVGVMGYVDIPSIRVSLPIYHGTDENVLQVAIGHLEGSSLPIGGEGSHSALSGHRGLPSARLFTDLDKLVEGDQFFLHILDETLIYEVYAVQIVKPYELGDLAIVEGEDLCTLITCTPYGVNSHRLLVQGRRTQHSDLLSSKRVTADAMQIDPILVAPFAAIPLLLVLAGVLAFDGKGRKKGKRFRWWKENFRETKQ